MTASIKKFSKKSTKKNNKKRVKNKKQKKTARRKYKRFHLFGGQGEECPICGEPLENGVFETNCKHKFHLQCIQQWCNKKSPCTCPICRTELIPNPNPIPQGTRFKIKFTRVSFDYETGRMINFPVTLDDIDEEAIEYIKEKLLGMFPGTEVDLNGREGYLIIPGGNLDDDANLTLNMLVTRRSPYDIIIDVFPEDDEFETYLVRLSKEQL
jgi:hypothetical protein